MTRTLFLDVTLGATAGSVLGALVDLGVAPSPVLHALGSLELGAHLVIEDTGAGHDVRAHPGEALVHARPREAAEWLARSTLPLAAQRVAVDALERLVEATRVPEEGACVTRHMLQAESVLAICGAAMAATSLEPARILVSRVPVEADPAPPVVELLGGVADALDFGAPSPVSEDAAALLVALTSSVGAAEPSWSGVVSRGRGVGGVRALLGEVGL